WVQLGGHVGPPLLNTPRVPTPRVAEKTRLPCKSRLMVNAASRSRQNRLFDSPLTSAKLHVCSSRTRFAINHTNHTKGGRCPTTIVGLTRSTAWHSKR